MGRFVRKIGVIFLLALFFLASCAPAKFTPVEPFTPEFQKTPPYTLDLDSIPKPEKIEPVYVDENFKEVTPDKAKFVLLVPKEYAKIAALLKLAKAYKEVAKEQEVLVNLHIDTINALKEYIKLEQYKTKAYLDLYANSENAYRQEVYYHKLDNAINKGTFATIAIGVIVALIAL